jgi:hypothetical protein
VILQSRSVHAARISQPRRYKNVIRYNARSPRWRHRRPRGQLNRQEGGAV